MMITKEQFLQEYTSPSSPISFASPGWIHLYYNKEISLKKYKSG